MTANDREWESLSDAWRAAEPPLDRSLLARAQAAYRRRLLATTAGEVVLVALFAWGTWLVARDGLEAWEAVWISTLWTCTAIAGTFAWRTRRHAWGALGESVAEFRRLRAARRARTVRFVWCLFAFEAVLVGGQLGWFGRFTMPVALVLCALAAILAGWSAWMRARIAEDLESESL
jgi:hypothetical protein